MSCNKWVHKKCSNVKGRLNTVADFKCPTCVKGVSSDNEVKELVLGKMENWNVLIDSVTWVI